MSKFVKNLVTADLKKRLDGVQDALLVNVATLDANRNYQLRKELRSKHISLLVVKNSMAQRATEGTVLAPGFEGLTGLTAIVWGGQDIVALAKEVVRLSKDKNFKGLETRGGVLDGAPLTAGEVEQVSNWPSREEQLSILAGQILGPGGRLASQLTSIGGALASQIKEIIERQGGEAAEADATASGDTAPAGEDAPPAAAGDNPPPAAAGDDPPTAAGETATA